MESFKLHITKAEINELPLRRYEGPVHLIRTAEEAKRAAEKLSGEPLLGFDTETRPAFRSGEKYLPSLLQLASGTEVFLFQLKETGLTEDLCRLLSDPAVIKAGVSIRDDLRDLRQLTEFQPAGFTELATFAKKAHIKNLGLRGLAALLLGFRISKKAQTANWARKELTDAQITYAATDAWLGRELYLKMDQLKLIESPNT